MQLQVHLEREQYVIFEQTDTQRFNEEHDTHLTAFFKANQQFPEAREILYPDFPSKFTWDYGRKRWYPRKGGKTSGRMVFIPPNAGEKFYARLILSHVTDLRSFDDLRTYNGIRHPTIREACFAQGLLADDGEWKHTLEEGKCMHTGRKLRFLFIVIIRDCQPSRPSHLWDLFKPSLCDDLP